MIERVCEILKSIGRQLDKRFDIIFRISMQPKTLKKSRHGRKLDGFSQVIVHRQLNFAAPSSQFAKTNIK